MYFYIFRILSKITTTLSHHYNIYVLEDRYIIFCFHFSIKYYRNIDGFLIVTAHHSLLIEF